MFFLYHRKTRPTGQVLAECLGIPHGTEPPRDREDVLIRWGSERRVVYRPGFTLNPASAIARASDKLESLRIMRAAGVIVPDFGLTPDDVRFPALARMREHTRGQDIGFCLQRRDGREYPSADYFVEYVPTDREYRARVVGDRCVRISEKVLRDEEQYVPYCRNYETGYVFMQPRTRLNAFQEALAVAAVRSLGLHFGAVDMVVGDDGHTYVLEVNTAPALAPRSAMTMLGGMVALIQERTGLELEPDYTRLDVLSENQDDGDTPDEEVEEDDQ